MREVVRSEEAKAGAGHAGILSPEICHAIAEHCDHGIVVLDEEGRISYANRAFSVVIGEESTAIAGKKRITDYLTERDALTLAAMLDALPADTDTAPSEEVLAFRNADGSAIPVRIRAFSTSPSGPVLLIVPIEEHSREADRFRTLLNNTGSVAYTFQLEPQRGFVSISAPIAAFTGYTPDECIRDPDFLEKTVHPDDWPLLKSIARGEFLWENTVVIRVISKDGGILWTEQRLFPIYGERGQLVGISGIASDVTPRILSEKRLRKSEDALKAFMNAIPETAALVDLKGRYITINEAGAFRMNSIANALTGRSMYDLLPPDIAQERKKSFSHVAKTGKAQRFWEHFNGRDISSIVYPVIGERDQVENLALIGIDVTEKKRMETEFREYKDRLELAIEATGIGIWDANLRTGEEIYCERWAGMLGYTLAHIVENGIVWKDLIHPDDYGTVLQRLQAYHEESNPLYRAEFRMRSADGAWKWIYSAGRVVQVDEGGTPVRMTGIHMNIDDRKRAEEVLKQREEHLSAIFNAARHLSFITVEANGPDFRILDFSPGSEAIFGYESAEIVGRPVAALHTGEDADRLPELFSTLAEDGKDYSREMVMRKKNGDCFPALCTIYPLFDHSGSLWAALHLTVDISAHKEAERAIRESEHRYQSLVECCPDPIFFFHDGTLAFTNHAGIRLLGAESDSELLGKPVTAFLAPGSGEMAVEIGSCRNTGRQTPPLREMQIRRLDGMPVTVEAIWVPVDEKGKPGTMVIARDISERKEAENALRESEERYRSLVELSPQTTLVHCDGTIVYTNTAGLEMLAAAKLSDIVGKEIFDFILPEFHELVKGHIRENRQGNPSPQTLDLRGVRLDGEVIDLEINSVPVMYKGKRAVQVIAKDITGRRKAEDQIQFWHKQLTISNEIIKVANSSMSLNEMMERILTMTMEMLEFDVGGIFLKNSDGRTANLAVSEGTTDAFGESMNVIHIHDWPHNLTFFAGQPHYVQDLPDETPSTIDLSILEEMGCRLYAGIPLVADSLIVGALYIGSRNRSLFSVREKGILESIGKEIGGTVLRGMLQDQLEVAYAEASTYLDILEKDLKNANEALLEYAVVVREMLEGSGECYARKLQSAIKQSIEIINNIATIRRIKDHPEEFEPVDLDTVVRREIAKFRDIDIMYKDTGIVVFADDLLPEIFANLIGNSVKYGGQDVKIRISVEELDGMVRVSIEDTGPGISDDIKHCIFSSFKPDSLGVGKGLGLQVSRLLVNRYCGSLEIEDRVPGKSSAGLAVRFTLAPYETDTVEIYPGDMTMGMDAVRNKRPDV